MANFVHLTPESRSALIRKNGIRRVRTRQTSGVYAMPVTANFYISHQWLRELKRRSGTLHVGVYFRIPDDLLVSIGRYNEQHQWMTAVQAVDYVTNCENRLGLEVIIPRRVEPQEIQRIRKLPQTIGWKYYPDSHGHKPCGCEYCQRGEYGARKLRDKYERSG